MKQLFVTLCLLWAVITPARADHDDIRLVLPDTSVFSGEKVLTNADSSAIYRGVVKSKDFSKSCGYFLYVADELLPLYLRITTGANDTIYRNSLSTDRIQREYYTDKEYFLDASFRNGQTQLKYVRVKRYDADRQQWSVIVKLLDSDYLSGRRYGHDDHYLVDFNDSQIEDTIMSVLLFFIAVGIFLWIILHPYVNVQNKKQMRWLLLSGTVLSVAVFVLTDKFTKLQLAQPFFSLLLISFVIRRLRLRRKVTLWLVHGVSCLLVIGFWVYEQGVHLHDSASLSDGTCVGLTWRCGTDWVKKHVIRRLFSNMVPVTVRDHGKEYVVYVSKYEFTEGELAVLNDDIAGWVAYLLHDDVLDGFSFRESQLVLKMIRDLCGVRLDFLSYSEWQSACQYP